MKKHTVFLDTNFLIASQIDIHPFNGRVKELLKEFYVNKTKVVAHTIVFDEFWYVLQEIQKTAKTGVGSLEKATNNIFSFEGFELLETVLDKEDLLKTLTLIKQCSLKPRDALILRILKKERIGKIATFDKDFAKVQSLEIVK
jgi:uncharacterized protein